MCLMVIDNYHRGSKENVRFTESVEFVQIHIGKTQLLMSRFQSVCLFVHGFTALFTNLAAGRLPDKTAPRDCCSHRLPFTAYGSLRNCTRQSDRTARNRETGRLVNSAVNRCGSTTLPLPPLDHMIHVQSIASSLQ